MAKITGLNHIAIVVPSIEKALEFWCDTFGLKLDHIEDVPSQKSRVAFLPLQECEVELVEPIEGNTGLVKFLDERGPGMHHLCFEVDDIEKMMDLLKFRGVRLINEEPVELPGRKMAFIHPKSAQGVLIELYEIK
jgi:methylmalonyl-CoA/ethylmalonyl-CoA epimerase